MKFQNPVIVIPGITGTSLVDRYPLREDEIWSMVWNREYERAAMHPDDLRYEAIEPAHIIEGELIPVYDDLINALRFELSPRADRPTPVFAFPYDWRVGIDRAAVALRDFVGEVIARTRLLRHYADAGRIEVDLVGHSMGGLVICEYLARYGRDAQAGRVATVGTPFLGAIEPVVKIATGMSLLTGSEPREREREAARLTPSVYQLFPSYAGAVVDMDGQDVDIYDPENMQSSILDSLTEFVRLYSVDTRAAERRERAASILADLLDGARRHREVVRNFRVGASATRQKDWLVIVGVGQKTRVQMTVDRDRRGPRFVIDQHQFVNELDATRSSPWRTGDGTVPLPGALPPFLPATRLVCVTEEDLDFFELRDRLLVEIGGFHGLLPRINLVQRLVTKHLMPAYRGSVWGRRVPGARSWQPPIDGLKERVY